ncbi:aromatic compound dioxygenase [Penicillium longicatenatum]|uniref:aromatic compound dioxygenase n=1 Tax=Penicillium longicatenatum TaxID=1561947 RepID=UPI0025472915|nr:aromatic compound dioxygenase [Penicillium longicatenatum]KAJ5661374.1 aromatic compound dioxygenase [Penicillium longicatenatum]
MFIKSALIGAVAFSGLLASAHPGPHVEPSPSELATRSEKAKQCSNMVGESKMKRHALRRREMAKRDLNGETTYEIHAEAPKYDFLKNGTTVLTPEVSEGPYWYPRSQKLRQDIAESQEGVPLVLDIALMDIDTCEPLTGVLVDIWHCNATGSYSSFTGLDPNESFGKVYKEQTGRTFSTSDGLPQSELEGLSTDSETWLRGMWPTDIHGATSFQTIFPGFYIERAIHIHVQVHTNWSVILNGTISHGPIVSTGQIFFAEELEEEIMAMEPYASHTQISRLKNVNDGIYTNESYNKILAGAMTIMDTEPLDGKSYKSGVLGYITLDTIEGVHTSVTWAGTL